MLKGTIVTLGVPQVIEIAIEARFDWVMIDMEHSALTLKDTDTLIATAGDRITTIVRVPGNDPVIIKQVLDLGCDGIMVPMVNSGEEAALAVSAANYPPRGIRSTGVGRAHGYGSRFAEYVSGANDSTIVMVQAEHIRAVNSVEEIVATPGLSALFIGPYDLSASMDLSGKVTHPDMVKAVDTIISACNRNSMPWGIFSMEPGGLSDYAIQGCRYGLCSTDTVMLMRAASAISAGME